MAGQQLRAARRGVSNHRPFPRRSRRRHRASHLSSGTNANAPADPPLPPRRRLGLRRSRAQRRPLPAPCGRVRLRRRQRGLSARSRTPLSRPRPTTAMRRSAGYAQHAGELGADPARIAIAGSSAGGNLAAAVTLMSRDRGGPRDRRAAPRLSGARRLPAPFRPMPSSRRAISSRPTTCAGIGGSISRQPARRGEPYACPLKADDLSGLPPASRDHRRMRSGARRWRSAMPRGLRERRRAGEAVALSRHAARLLRDARRLCQGDRRRCARRAISSRPLVSGAA